MKKNERDLQQIYENVRARILKCIDKYVDGQIDRWCTFRKPLIKDHHGNAGSPCAMKLCVYESYSINLHQSMQKLCKICTFKMHQSNGEMLTTLKRKQNIMKFEKFSQNFRLTRSFFREKKNKQNDTSEPGKKNLHALTRHEKSDTRPEIE